MIDPSTLTNRAWPRDARSQALLQRWIVDLQAQLAELDRQIDALRQDARARADRLLDTLVRRDAIAAQLEQATREVNA